MASAAALRQAVRDHATLWRLRAAARRFRGATALELGGPSTIFDPTGPMPVYPVIAQLDIIDFAADTLWSSSQSGATLPEGDRSVGEARWLRDVADESYDLVLASHVIEHVANPLGALTEWRRVTRRDGTVLLVVPHREGTFDHRRPVTSIEHLRDDEARDTEEDDVTHLEEVIALHDLARDAGAGDAATFAERCRNNGQIRGMHHHVFDTRSVAAMCQAAGLEVGLLRALLPFHIVAICRVGPVAHRRFTVRRALLTSPFLSDRQPGLA